MIENGTVVTLEGATIMFRNFAGKEAPFNKAGDRNFCVAIPEDLVESMERDGWNIKMLRAREEGETPQRYLQIAVSYKIRKPRVLLLGSNSRTPLPEELVELADFVDVAFADVTFRARQYEMNGRVGIKAYLQTIYIKVIEDPLDIKYADVPVVSIENLTGQKQIGSRDVIELESTPHYDYEGEVV
jgi:hypothetical protein